MVTLEQQLKFIKQIPQSEVRDAIIETVKTEIERCNMNANSVVIRIPVESYKQKIKELYDETKI